MHEKVKHGMREWSMHACLMCVGSNAYLWETHRPPASVVPPPRLLHACPQLAATSSLAHLPPLLG